MKIFHLFGFPSWKSSGLKIIGIKTYLFKKAPRNSRWPFYGKSPFKRGNYTIFRCLIILGEAGKQTRNLTKNVPKILYLKLSSKQIFSEHWCWVPLLPLGKQYVSEGKWELTGQVDYNFFSCPVWAHGDRGNCSSSCLKSTCELLAESIFLYTLFEDLINT